MKKIFILIALFSFGVSLTGQDTVRNQDLVILKDGSRFKGELLEYHIDSHIILQTDMTQPLRFTLDKVEKVIQDYKEQLKDQKKYTYDRNYYQVELGTPMSSEGDYGLEASVSGIRQINAKLGIGLGVSYVNYRSDNYYFGDIKRIPVFLIYRAYLREGNTAPYIQVNAGYAFNPHETDYKAGFHANPKIGLRFAQDGVMFHLFLGAHFTQCNSDYFENPWDSGGWEQKRTIRRTTIGMGISF